MTPREYQLKTKYGITEADYNKLLKKQKNACAVCLRPTKHFKNRLAVDHNHITGEIRGLLCFFCNKYLVGRHKVGTLLRSAADYLDRTYTGWFVPEKPKKIRKRKKKS